MKWLEITIDTEPEAEEIVSAVLLEAGAQGVNVKGITAQPGPWDYLDAAGFKAGPFCVSAYFPESEAKDALDRVTQKISELPSLVPDVTLGSLQVLSALVDEADWENAWKAYFKPMHISERVVVCPSWEDYTPLKDELVIGIDPGMAFGTGSHETTRMCVSLLEEFLQDGMEVIDAGCGSGILSIAAALLGARRVYALDFDPVAVAVAKGNVARNGFADRIHVERSDLLAALDETKKADIVVANIIADIVIRLAGEGKRNLKQNGMFIASGIIDSRLGDVTDALEKNGFRVIQIMEEGEWRAVAAKNKT